VENYLNKSLREIQIMKKQWNKKDVLYVLTELKTKMSFVDWNEIHKQIANDLGTSVASVKMTLQNCRYIAIGEGLENYSQAQKDATEQFVKEHTNHFFKLI
jgi:hypothetical protein